MRFVRLEALKNHGERASHSQPGFAKHFKFGYVAGLIDQRVGEIRRCVPTSEQTNLCSIK